MPADGVSPAGHRAKSCLLADLAQATLTGMIGAFGRELEAGLGQPHAITGGIGEALIATAMGRLVAIVPLITHKDFRARLEESGRGGRRRAVGQRGLKVSYLVSCYEKPFWRPASLNHHRQQ
ncbi:MAG: MotA/TolQ/ExbB proton channel family protein [Candidatus Entotheonellia bacterium]